MPSTVSESDSRESERTANETLRSPRRAPPDLQASFERRARADQRRAAFKGSGIRQQRTTAHPSTIAEIAAALQRLSA